MLLVGFRPEERQESVAPVEPSRGGRSQEAEEAYPFGLSQDGRHLTPGLHSRGDPAKQSELDGRRSRKGGKAAVVHAARNPRCGQERIALVTQRNARSGRRQRPILPDFTLGSRARNAREVD